MGRKKLDKERTQQILDAFGRCVLKNGLENSGISAVAREAGLSRTLVHHFVGTLDNLIVMLSEAALELHKSQTEEFLTWFEKGHSVEAMFSDELDNPVDETLTEKALYSILYSSRGKYPAIDNAAATILEGWTATITHCLHRSGRGESEAACRPIAATLLSLSLGWDMLRGLSDAENHKKELKNQFKRIVESLPKRMEKP